MVFHPQEQSQIDPLGLDTSVHLISQLSDLGDRGSLSDVLAVGRRQYDLSAVFSGDSGHIYSLVRDLGPVVNSRENVSVKVVHSV